MIREDLYTHQKVRRLCRDIGNQSHDRRSLETLVVRLQDALREERCETRAVKLPRRPEGDDPFDKIMVI
jgi:hypothetical protein